MTDSQWASNFSVYFSLKERKELVLTSFYLLQGKKTAILQNWKIFSAYDAHLCTDRKQKLCKQYNMMPMYPASEIARDIVDYCEKY